jgi:hypothetical protein
MIMARSSDTFLTLLILGIGGYFVYTHYLAGAAGTTQVVGPGGQPAGTTNAPPAVGSTTNAPPGTTFYNPNGTNTMVDNSGNVIPMP